MSSNDRVLLEQILEQRRGEIAPECTESEFFELFVAEQLLKDRALSYDELKSGLVGGGNDGGIDGLWTFANGDLVLEDTDLSALKKGVQLELVIVQCKKSKGFKEETLNKFVSVFEHLFDLSKDPLEFKSRYNEEVLERVLLFRETYQKLAGRFPALHISFHYVSLGDEPHPNVTAKAHDLKAKVPALFSHASTSVEFVGATALISMARQQPKTSFELKLAETSISTAGAIAYICLVKLQDWYEFITDENKAIRTELFESNVRDYQGSTEVNKEIQSSLKEPGPEDFWWLNNGITVLASKATQSGKTLTIETPQIVNGLQTSQQIFNFFSTSTVEGETRLVLVRVIVPEKEDSRDRIIKATNSQTYIPPASLKATDKIQRDIEEYLRARGIFYDRRKNHYKNEGKPLGNIVGIPKMAQALMSIVLARPDTARARPSSLIKSADDYAQLFSEEHPIQVYWVCIGMLRLVENELREMENLQEKDRNNLKFYAALQLARTVCQEAIPSLTTLKAVDISSIAAQDVTSAVAETFAQYIELGGTDKVAKGAELKSKLDAHPIQPSKTSAHDDVKSA